MAASEAISSGLRPATPPQTYTHPPSTPPSGSSRILPLFEDMGGIDIGDQVHSYDMLDHRCRRGPFLALFTRVFLEVILTNIWLNQKLLKLTSHQFRMDLVHQLLTEFGHIVMMQRTSRGCQKDHFNGQIPTLKHEKCRLQRSWHAGYAPYKRLKIQHFLKQ